MKVRFLADANLDRQITEGLCRREPSIDFLSAEAAGLHGKNDLEVLEIAAVQRRLLVTHDKRTMPSAFGEFLTNQHSSGVLIVPAHLGIGPAVDALLAVWLMTEQEEWADRISYIPIKTRVPE